LIVKAINVGNVGINQTDPTSMLHVGGSSANADSSALHVEDGDGNLLLQPGKQTH